jgi:transposase
MIKSRPSIPAPKKARGAKEMADSDKIPQIDPTEIEILIEKLEQNKLEERERRLIVALLRTFLYIVAQLQEKKITLLKIKDMIFGRKSEKNKREKEKSKEGEKETAEGGLERSRDDEQSQEPKNEKQESDGAVCAPDKRGHGRNPVSAYPGAKKVRCRHRELQSGHDCPDMRCDGKVYRVLRPRQFTQFTGQSAITVTIYEQEVMRCNDCGKEYEAPLPEGVSPKRYDETADATIAIIKCGLATPYNRSAALQRDCGMPLSESVMSERCEAVAEALFPIYKEMRRQAANGKVFYGDDTPARILELMKENREKKPGERVGMQSSGIVVRTEEGHYIALYMSGRKHAGENLEELFEMRSGGLELPIQMGDELASNWSGEKKRIQAVCMPHARRKFWEIRSFYPNECGYVLERIGKIYQNEEATKGMRSEQRLEYHQTHSQEIMEELREWMEGEMAEKKVEPNSSLGKAIKYYLKNYPGLSAFLRHAEAPLDNNQAERALKPVVMIRKNSYFYKTGHGANVGAIILSMITSCRLNRTNVWNWMVSVLKRSSEASRNPAAFLPWVYKGEAVEEEVARAA